MIYLDIETLDFFADAHIKSLPRAEQLTAMRFGIAVTYNDVADEWLEWTPDQLPDLWAYLRYAHSDAPVAGWNIAEFDWPVIRNNVARFGDAILYHGRQPELDDLFQRIKAKTGRWYKLEVVAQTNLGRGKSADGQQAAEWLREWSESGDQEALRKALDYCRLDVELERDLYLHLAQQPLRLPPRVERGELNELLYYADGTVERLPDAMGVVSTN